MSLKKFRPLTLWIIFISLICSIGLSSSFAATPSSAPNPTTSTSTTPTLNSIVPGLSDSPAPETKGMTLWELIKAGGIMMGVLGFLSITVFSIIIYNFKTLTVNNLSPIDFTEEVIQKLEEGDEKVVREMCQEEDNIIANVVIAGLAKKYKGKVFAREAMESSVRQEISTLWQNISYLADIGSVAPLVGLLGTVIGMIQAFNVFAFQTGAVKPIMLVGGVSKALVTTAGGIFVAIPALLFYYYFKGRVLGITNVVESYSSEIIKIIEEA